MKTLVQRFFLTLASLFIAMGNRLYARFLLFFFFFFLRSSNSRARSNFH